MGEVVLLEREAELTRLRELCEAAAAGGGATVAVQGPAGVGKTALLASATVSAEGAGMLVLSASGAELERELPFGVARQLFERYLRELDEGDRAALLEGAPGLARSVVLDPEPGPPRPEAAQAAMHGLYWLAAELAARRPLLLVVDDAHWADAPSLRWLAYLARRLDGVALVAVLGCRDAEPGADTALLLEVLAEAHADVLGLCPLTRAGVERWLNGIYDERPAGEFVEGCWTATGGNPFLLAELTAELRAEGLELRAEGLAASATAAARIAGIGPATIARSVLPRLARLGSDAVAVAETVAILSADARPGRVATLAGLTPQYVGELTDVLVGAGILGVVEPFGFTHPVLRNVVYEQIPAIRRGLAHAASARCLLSDGAGPERAAAHMLLAPMSADPLTVETLRAAARAAMARGAPDTAAVLLGRALAEPPDNRSEILLELAAAEAMAQDPAAVEHARAVFVDASTATQRAQAATIAASAQLRVGDIEGALEMLAAVEPDTDDLDDATTQELRALTLLVSSFRGASGLEPQLLALGADDLVGTNASERLLLTLRCLDLHLRACSRDRALVLARRVLAQEVPGAAGHDAAITTCARVLAMVDCMPEARDAFTALIEGGRARGAVIDVAMPYALRSEAARLAGSLGEAEADARLALDIATVHGLFAVPATLGQLAAIMIEREHPAEVLKLLESYPGDLRELPPFSVNNVIFYARGRARAANGDVAGAAEDFEACGLRQMSWGVLNPADIAWRSSLALALHSLGKTAEANRLAQEELEIARDYGVARALGVALRARALVGPGHAVVPTLQEAMRTLADSPARLEHARVLVDLGAAQRRAGHRKEARDTLRAGLDAADRCGAHQLSARARAELRAAGARPRRERLSGPEALTASERRVAQLAAEGSTNRQIAQALFVTTKTIEMHLGRAYPKLGINRRTELAACLGSASDEENPPTVQV